MSARVRSRSMGSGRGQESSSENKPVMDQKPSGERSEHHESPKKSQGIEPRQEGEGEIIVIESDEESELEIDCLEMGVEKTRGERGDSPDAKGKILPYLEHANTPEAGCNAQEQKCREEGLAGSEVHVVGILIASFG
ncbi:P antigen family member 4 [Castor canadensis]|uniref:P antigen family member 4 n=1 Tax=Castor canadensis TaxID=51338 RepID=A0AC58LMK3_CASCN